MGLLPELRRVGAYRQQPAFRPGTPGHAATLAGMTDPHDDHERRLTRLEATVEMDYGRARASENALAADIASFYGEFRQFRAETLERFDRVDARLDRLETRTVAISADMVEVKGAVQLILQHLVPPPETP